METRRFCHCEAVYTDAVSHFTAVDRLPDGRLFSVGSFGKVNAGGFVKDNTSNFVIGRVSEDEGRTWKLSFCRELPSGPELLGAANMLIARDGHIHVFFMRIQNISFEAASKCKGDITYMRLDNAAGDGLVYRKIDALDRYTGAMNNAIQLAGGRIVAPFSTLSGVEGSAFVSSVVYSDDNGESWRASNDVSVISDETHLESGAVEPVVVEVEKGVLVMLIRTVLNRIWYSVSYDGGASWCQAKPTRIPSSNAPSAPIKLADGRIVLAWNNTLGHPMSGTRYSFARQCLHAAVSDDGLKTLKGVRAIVGKRRDDPDNLLNCYPFCGVASEKDVFIRFFSVNNREGAHWGDPQAVLLRLNADKLTETEMNGSTDEWVTDCAMDDKGIHMKPTKEGVAYACINFPYATEGEIRLRVSGNLPKGTRLLLADSYLDRLGFLPSMQGDHAGALNGLFVELHPTEDGEWKLEWNRESLSMTTAAGSSVHNLKDWARGFNHLILLYEGSDEEVLIEGFEMKAIQNRLETGIEY